MSLYSHRPQAAAREILLLFGLAILLWPPIVSSQSVRSQQEIGAIVAIDKLVVQNGAVSGEVANRSAHMLRDVQLYVRFTWLWDDEFHPGDDDPGAAFISTLEKEIPPGGRLSFTFSPSPPLPKLSGGRFIPSVSIAAFTEIVPPSR